MIPGTVEAVRKRAEAARAEAEKLCERLSQPDLAQAGGGRDTIKTLEQQVKWLENIGIELCFDMHGAEPNQG